MSLLKYACIIGDKSIKIKVLDIIAKRKSCEQMQQNMVITADAAQALTDEQSQFMGENYERLRGILRSFLSKRGVTGELANEMVGEGLLEAMTVLPKYWDLEPSAIMNVLITSAQNAINVKLMGARKSGGSGTSVVDVEKSWSSKVLPSVVLFLTEQLRGRGINDPRQASLEDIEKLLKDFSPDIDRLVLEENKRRDKKVAELKKQYIATNGTEDGFTVPQKLRPTKSQAVKSRFKTQWKQSTDQAQQGFVSLDNSGMEGGFSDGAMDSADAISNRNLLSLLGFESASNVPEDMMIQDEDNIAEDAMRQERVMAIADAIYAIPVVLRVIMASAFNIETDVLQQTNEVDVEIANISQTLGIDVGDVLNNMRTKGGSRLSWASVKNMIKPIYGDELLKGIKNHKEFEAKIQQFFTEVVDALGM